MQAARNEFIREYNRLAALAAAAPDIHIYMANRRLDNPDHNTINHHNRQRQQPATQFKNQVHAPVAPAFNRFAFTANLGANKQFVPQANTFPAAPQHSGHLAGHLAGHQAGHLASHQASLQAVRQQQAKLVPHAQGPIMRWNGPFADTVPAGVHGLPRQVLDTPAVAAAKAAHFAAHNAARQSAPRRQTHF